MSTYKILKQLNNRQGGVHSDLRKKIERVEAESDAPSPATPVDAPPIPAPKAKGRAIFFHFTVFVIAMAFLLSFWMIYQLVNTQQAHEFRFQRILSAMENQEASLKSIGQKITAVTEQLPKINEDIAALAKKTDAAYVEAAKLSETVAGMNQAIESLKQQTATAQQAVVPAEQAQTASQVK